MSDNTNTNTIALVRAMLPREADGVCPAVVRRDGRARSAARLEVVRKDPSGSWVWVEVQLGLATKSGMLDFSAFPRRDTTVAGYTRRVGKRQVILTKDSLLPWQDGNLRYAQGRLERQAHDAPVPFEVSAYVKAEERVLHRRGADGKIREITWLPEMTRGADRTDLVESLGLDAKITDAELIDAVGGDAAAGIIPACLLRAVVPEAILLDLRPFKGWVAVDASTIPGLLSLEEFDARERARVEKEDLKRNGLRVRPQAQAEAPSVEEAAPAAVTAEVTEEAQG